MSQVTKGKDIEIWTTKTTRDFVYVYDVIRAFIKAIEMDLNDGPINIGSGKEHNVGEVAKLVANSEGRKVTSLDKQVIGPLRQCVDISKAEQVLDWKPRYTIEEAIVETLNWYKNNTTY